MIYRPGVTGKRFQGMSAQDFVYCLELNVVYKITKQSIRRVNFHKQTQCQSLFISMARCHYR